MTQAVKESQTVTFRVDKKMVKQLDKIAELMDRPRAYFLKQGMENILDLYDWQLKKISEGERQIKQGKFASQAEIDKVFRL